MKSAIKVLVVLLLAFTVMGCNSEETKTVEWYMAPENKQALHDRIAECRNNPGQLEKAPNCINAQEAADTIVLGGKMFQGNAKRQPHFDKVILKTLFTTNYT